ncbi:hypothetical protein SPRG_10083 [Saprolegnia parasitica CBS 223.65]|uniref:Uncharacterized protein n=1 Tax=Saprolegnia parasitica (strain CBS 223.65) TaxID=695850 RepID=A0A067CAT8_SAPPC|nr:hypothetical protein SPRG_10083 [Saprolegnia parasitica CBS 223.65]KDO23937.1 hypothetical protein SPRG_10083 [Saprolegnia parasitica CBS 223.65]|eukprot:XP_012205401.1 hypothetical protein SPRG_10083 [Saprolegnia parasitica CBS 223.65]
MRTDGCPLRVPSATVLTATATSAQPSSSKNGGIATTIGGRRALATTPRTGPSQTTTASLAAVAAGLVAACIVVIETSALAQPPKTSGAGNVPPPSSSSSSLNAPMHLALAAPGTALTSPPALNATSSSVDVDHWQQELEGLRALEVQVRIDYADKTARTAELERIAGTKAAIKRRLRGHTAP